MFHPSAAFIGLRYARANKGNHFIAFINFFSVVGIALGLMALITVSSVMNGFEGQLKNRVLGLIPHIVVNTQGATETQISELRTLPGVASATSLIESEGVMQSPKDLSGVFIQGIEPDFMHSHSVVADNMLFGSFHDLEPSEYGIIIGRALSINLGLRPGDKTRLISAGTSMYTPLGRMPSQRVFRVVGIYDLASEMDNKVVFVHINDSARLQRTKVEKAQKTRLFLQDAFEYKQVESQISHETDNWRARQGPLFDAVKMEKNMMSLMLLLIIAVAAFNIVSALVMVVTEKQGDIAILRTQGMSQTEVMSIFLFNGMFNGIKGTLLGLFGGLLLVSQLNLILDLLGSPMALGANGEGLPVEVQWSQVSLMVAMSILLCFVATLYPAYRAIKVEPAKALQYE